MLQKITIHYILHSNWLNAKRDRERERERERGGVERASGMFVQRKYERDNDTQAYLQRKNERDNATQAWPDMTRYDQKSALLISGGKYE